MNKLRLSKGNKIMIKVITNDGLKEIKGKTITYKDVTFCVPAKEEYFGMEFQYNGFGFNGNWKRNLASLKEAEERIGTKFWKRVKEFPSMEEVIKKHEDTLLLNKTYYDRVEKVKKKTGIKLKRQKTLFKSSINIFDLEKQLTDEHGYINGEISLKDFITNKWGEDISTTIKSLL